MRPHFPTLRTRLAAFITGRDITHAPINGKGGRLRDLVEKAAHSPVHGMEIIDGKWWAHTAWGFHPVQHYFAKASQEGQTCSR